MEEYRYNLSIREYEAYYEAYYRSRRSYEWNFDYADHGPDPRYDRFYQGTADPPHNWNFDYGPEPRSDYRHLDQGPSSSSSSSLTLDLDYESRRKEEQLELEERKKQKELKRQKKKEKKRLHKMKLKEYRAKKKQQKQETVVHEPTTESSPLYDGEQRCIETVIARQTLISEPPSEEPRHQVLTTVNTTPATSECPPSLLTEPILSEDDDESVYDPEQSPILYADSICSVDGYSTDDTADTTKFKTLSTLQTENVSSDEDLPRATPSTALCTYPTLYSQANPVAPPAPSINPVLYTEVISSDDDSVEMACAEPPASPEEAALYDPYADSYSTINMVIVLWNYPEEKFTDEQEASLRNTLLEEVFKCPRGTSPKFDDSYFKRGAMYIICANQETRSWLLKKVPRMQPWKGAVLKVGTAEEILKNRKVSVSIPKKIVDKTEGMKILELIGKQNRQLDVNNWQILDSQVNSQGISLTLSVDHESWWTLGDMNFQPYLGLGQIEFKEVK